MSLRNPSRALLLRPRLDRLEGREVPAVFTVDTARDVGDRFDGQTSLREAIADANAAPGADEIRFQLPAGSTITLDISGLGRLPAVADPVSIVGPGAGRLAVSGNRQGRVFGFLPQAGLVSVSGLTVADGLEVGEQAAAGGIFNAADLTLADVAVVNNTATTAADVGRGGGLFNAPGGTARVVRSRFAGNVAPDGGAVYNLGTLVLTDSDLSSNRAVAPDTARETTGSGGAVFNKAADGVFATVTAVNTRFVGNVALDRGGGLYADGGWITVTGGEVANNVVTQPGGLGGGVFADFGAALVLTDVAVTGNQTAGDGGGVYTTIVADSTLDGVRVEGNRAGGSGGGLFHQSNTGGLLAVTRSIVRGNSAGAAGGGVVSNLFGGAAVPITRLDGVTLAGNTAPVGAGLQSAGRPSVVVTGSTVADPAAGAAVSAANNTGPAAGGLQSVGRFTAYGTGAGLSGRVRLVRPGQADLQFAPFEDTFRGGVRVAVADVNLDGSDDVVVGAGPGGGPRVVVYSGWDGTQIANFFAFEPSFRNGAHVGAAGSVRVAAGRPGRTSLITVGAGDGSGPAGSPRVRGFFDFRGVPTEGVVGTSPVDFFAYDERFQGGVRVAAADLAGDGSLQLVTVPGPGGGPDLRVWDVGQLTETRPTLRQQLPGLGSDGGYRGGAFVAASGGAILVSPDSLTADPRPPLVSVFAPAGGGRVATVPNVVGLNDPGFRGGVRVAAGAGSVAVGYGAGGRGRVRTFAFTPAAAGLAEVTDGFPFGDLGAGSDIYVGLPPTPGPA